MESKIKFLGLPLHPMLVAYPIAFYTSTLVAFIIYTARGDLFWFKVAVVANLAGVVMAVVAAIPGFLDWRISMPRNSAAKVQGRVHGLLNGGALIFFVINSVLYLTNFSSTQPGSVTVGIVLSIVGMLLTLAGGFSGFMMTQTDRIGIQLVPPGQESPSAGTS